MTAIVGLAHEGKVYIGADSAGTSGYHVTERSDAKVFRRGPMLFGVAGSFRVGQVIRHTLEIPRIMNGLTSDVVAAPVKYLVSEFVNALRECLSQAGELEIKESITRMAGLFLVGYNGNLYGIDRDFQVIEPADGFYTLGSGLEFALGSLATSTGAPVDRVRKALEVAGRYTTSVQGPYVVDSI